MENTAPFEYFQTIHQAVLGLANFLNTAFKERGVEMWEQNVDPAECLICMHSGLNGIGFDFDSKLVNPSSDFHSVGFIIIFWPSGRAFIRFEWSVRNTKNSISKSGKFEQKNLSLPATLDLLAKFLKGEVLRDRKSRDRFLLEFNNTTNDWGEGIM